MRNTRDGETPISAFTEKATPKAMIKSPMINTRTLLRKLTV